MKTPLELPAPTDAVEQIHAFARDLAYGAVEKKWSAKITITPRESGVTWFSQSKEVTGQQDAFYAFLANKWGLNPPPAELLFSFGYFQVIALGRHGKDEYLLTEKAFALLAEPAAKASIFVSYSRQDSSAFALLLLARFKAVGLEPFLDIQDLKPGDDWRAKLKKEVYDRDYFICVIAPDTFQSPFVKEEIRWAMESDSRTIPVWHGGFEYKGKGEDAQGEFLRKNAVIVKDENAKDYNNAVLELLNLFGYTPM